MILVIGTFTLDPKDREAFLASRAEGVKRSRAEDGCITYTFGPDLLDPGVVVLTERWRDQAALDAHLAGLRSSPPANPGVDVLSREIMVYAADDGTPL